MGLCRQHSAPPSKLTHGARGLIALVGLWSCEWNALTVRTPVRLVNQERMDRDPRRDPPSLSAVLAHLQEVGSARCVENANRRRLARVSRSMRSWLNVV